MKGNRLFSRVNLLLLTMLIVACQGGNVSTSKNSNSNSSKDNVNTSSSIDISKNQLLISEYVEGSANFAVELYNFTDKDANLSDYTFNVYGKSEIVPTGTIELSGTLKAKETYVIVSSLTVSEELEGITKVSIVASGMRIVEIFIQGKYFFPLLNLIKSKIAPKRVSFTASHTFTTSITAPDFMGSIPKNRR